MPTKAGVKSRRFMALTSGAIGEASFAATCGMKALVVRGASHRPYRGV